MTIKNIKDLYRSIAILLVLLLCAGSVYSVSGLNAVLSSQNPDPVSPGNFVYLNVKISNIGEDNIQDVKISFVENNLFKLAAGSDLEKDLGVIPAYSGATGAGNFVVAKFKVKVDEKAPLGLNTAKFLVEGSGLTSEYEFDVLVQDKNPRIQINDFNVGTIQAGRDGILEMEIENVNTITLKDITISLGLDEVEGKVINLKDGSNKLVIPALSAGEKKKISFGLTVSPDAESKPYLLPVSISYEDSLDNEYSSDILGTVRVYSEPILSLNLDTQEFFETNIKSKITLAIANPSVSTIKGTQIEIVPTSDYGVVEGGFNYVGDLNPDDFQTVQSQILPKATDDFNIVIRAKYLDSYNREVEKTFSVPYTIYTSDEMKDLGIASVATGGSNVIIYIVSLVLIVFAFFIGKKVGFNKGKKKKIEN